MVFVEFFDFIALKKRFTGIAFALCLLFAIQPAQAGLIDSTTLDTEILGGSFFVANDGNVTATFLGSDASYFNTLYLVFPTEIAIFNRDYTGPDVLLGSFNAGTELIFRLDVQPDGSNGPITDSFFTGIGVNNPGYNNLDEMAHARAVTTLVGENYLTTVGFEDIYGGGDRDYNDFMFSLTNVIDPPAPVPEPRLLLLLSCGLFILTLFSRRRKILNSAEI